MSQQNQVQTRSHITYTTYYANGNVEMVIHYANKKIHKVDGPAIEHFCLCGYESHIDAHWYEHGICKGSGHDLQHGRYCRRYHE